MAYELPPAYDQRPARISYVYLQYCYANQIKSGFPIVGIKNTVVLISTMGKGVLCVGISTIARAHYLC
jgi:hypothetical protein